MQFVWEDHQNLDVSTLHVDIRLPRVDSLRWGLSDREKVAPEDREFQARLVAIEGVVDASIGTDCYQCSITKGKVFPWGPIRRAVVDEFRRRYEPAGSPVANEDAAHA